MVSIKMQEGVNKMQYALIMQDGNIIMQRRENYNAIMAI